MVALMPFLMGCARVSRRDGLNTGTGVFTDVLNVSGPAGVC